MGIAIPQVVTEDRASSAFVVDGSLKFNGTDQYLRKTFGTAGHQSIFTWSCWVKRNHLDTWQRIFTCEPGSNLIGGLSFKDTDSKIRLQQQGFSENNHLITSAYYRDTAAWYHIVMRVDTFHATAADRFRIYINGERQEHTWSTGGNPTQGSQLYYNTTSNYHEIGHSTQYNAYYKGQMTQCYWLDGQSLGPEHFGFTDPLTNTWRPKNYVKGAFEELDKFNTYTWAEPQNQLRYQGIKFPSAAGGTVAWKATGSSNTGLNLYTSTDNSNWTRRLSNQTVDSTNGLVYESSDQYVILVNGSNTNWSNQLQMYSDVNGAKIHYSNGTYPGNGNPTMSWSGPTYTDGTIGSYNSFYLPMNGSSPLGEDKSGNGNDWTPINFGGSVELPNATGAFPILNTFGGVNAKPGVFSEDTNATYTTTSASNSGGKYVFEGLGTQPTFSFVRGATYTFDWSASSGHPLRFATAADAAGSTEYTDGTNVSGNVTKITVPHNAPDTLYYYCNVHNGMGNSISVTTDVTKADPYAWKCVLALPLLDNNADFSSEINCTTTAKVLAVNGNAAYNQTESHFYNGGFYFDGNGDYLGATTHADFAMGTGDFTLECWVYRGSSSGFNNFIATRGGPGTSAGFTFGAQSNSNGNDVEFYTDGLKLDGGIMRVTNGHWHHCAVTRTGSTLNSYVDGVLSVTATNSQNFSNTSLAVGMTNDGNQGAMSGYLQDVRIYKGVAKYSGGSVGDQLFAPAAGANPDFLPDSPSGATTKTQLPKVSSSDKNKTLSFPTQASKLVLGNQYTPITGTGDYTISFWFYANKYDSADGNGPDGGFDYILTQAASHPTYPIGVTISKAGKIVIQDSANFGSTWLSTFDYSGSYNTKHSIRRGQWSYVHVVRSSGTLSIYNNGNLQYSRSQSSASPTPTGDITICLNTGSCMVRDFRVEGAAITDPTPPTSTPTATGNTRVLLSGLNDISGNNVALTNTSNVLETDFSPYNTDIDLIRGAKGNYCTMNPVSLGPGTISDGNLRVASGGSSADVGTIFMSTGKFYWEVTVKSGSYPRVGVYDVEGGNPGDLGGNAKSWCLLNNASRIYHNASATGYGNFTGSAGEVVGVAYDADAGKIWYSVNGYYYNGGNPETGSNPSQSSVTGRAITPAVSQATFEMNFGQKPFKFPPPEGFQPITTSTVRSDSTITRPDQFFAVTKYDGNTDTSQDINVGFAPDLVWQKIYSQAGNNALTDTVRGVGAGFLKSDTADQETGNANDGVSAFLSNGFRAYNGFNNNGLNWVSWCWKAGGSGSQPFYIDGVGYATAAAAGLDNGSEITPIGASIGTKQGFSIITYTATNSNTTVPHGLTQKPNFAIFKNRDSTLGINEVDWGVYHSDLGATKSLELNQTRANETWGGPFNNTEPSTTKFTLGTGNHSYLTNGPSGNKFIAYIWHDVPGLQRFGTYVGNGSGNGPYINCGFKPAMVWMKAAVGGTSNWVILDNTRPGYNSEQQTLCTNLNSGHNASGGTTNELLSNGFKVRGTTDRNTAGVTYIYCAWAEAPQSNLYGAQSNAV